MGTIIGSGQLLGKVQAPAPDEYVEPEVQEAVGRITGTDIMEMPVEEVPGIVGYDGSKTAEIRERANQMLADLFRLNPNDPGFLDSVKGIRDIGTHALTDAGTGSPLLDVKLGPLMKAREGRKDAPQAEVAKSLVSLRHAIDEISPDDDGGVDKLMNLLKRVPLVGGRIQNTADNRSTGMDQIRAILDTLEEGKARLESDIATAKTERIKLWEAMKDLTEQYVLLGMLAPDIEARIATLIAEGDSAGAEVLQGDVLFKVKQQQQDIATQLAVAAQAYLSYDLVRRNNEELVDGVNRALRTTLPALQTAMATATAVARQAQVADAVGQLNETTGKLLLKTSEMLKATSVTIQQQAVGAVVDPKVLQRSFDNIRQTLEGVEGWRAKAAIQMDSTVQALEASIRDSVGYVSSSMALEAGVDEGPLALPAAAPTTRRMRGRVTA